MSSRIHIVTHSSGWAVKREGHNDPQSVHDTQREAIDAAREVAVRDESDIVVHRRDGSFRNVMTYVDEENGRHPGERKARVQPEDILSVGSRISWGAVLAGAVIALTVYMAFSVLATAIGLSITGGAGGENLAIGAVIAWVIICLASMFLGGYVVSRTTAGENTTEAVIYGLVLWGALFIGFAVLAAMGIGLGAEMMGTTPAQTQPAAVTHPDEALQGMELSEQQRADIRGAYDTARQEVAQAGPVAVSWWTFVAMMLSMGAAVLGAVAGAGPNFTFTRGTATKTKS